MRKAPGSNLGQKFVRLDFLPSLIHYLETVNNVQTMCGAVLLVYSGCETVAVCSTAMHYLGTREQKVQSLCFVLSC
jgi:hypothetical protein